MDSMNTEQGTQTETMGRETETQGQEHEETEKTFTQKEVNSIIQSRLDKMKEQAAKEAKADYEQKIEDLKKREMKVLLKEKLEERKIPKEFADLITCVDEDDLNQKLETLSNIYERSTEDVEPNTGFFAINPKTGKKENIKRNSLQIGAKPQREEYYQPEDPIRKAMKMN